MSNILVTGVAGFIGGVVAELFVKGGDSVVGIDNFQEGKPENVNKKIKFYEGNYGSKNLLGKIFSESKIDFVFHFAAETTIEYSMSKPAIYFHNNVINGINLLDSMLENNVKDIIFSSTAAVYGEPKYLPIDELHEKSPINAYGESKLIFEKILDWYCKAYGLRYNLFRYFNAAGAIENFGENREHETHLLPLVFKAALDDGYFLKIFGKDYNTKDGTCVRDYLHVEDIAKAHILAIKNLSLKKDGKYNLGSGTGFTILEVVSSVERITNKKVKWAYDERRVGDPEVLVSSSSLAVNELGWNPVNSSLDKIIKDSYDWFTRSNF